MSPPALAARRRARVRVAGTVQGVGFRPYVYRLACSLGLDGFVFNDSHGVLVEVEGEPLVVASFLDRIAAEAPPLAVVERVDCQDLAPVGAHGFSIHASPAGGTPDAPVTPDSATCADCLAELFDPSDRRYRYPFTNCTNCGPRFTIVRGIPYDRPLTTMAAFGMCVRCQAEYEDPGDRRFHAQPNACPECGPRVTLLDASGVPVEGTGALGGEARALDGGAGEPGGAGGPSGAGGPGGAGDPIAALAAELRAGAVAAIKGIGGYHLACRADDEEAVARLRARKHREDKPFALMAADVETARRLVTLDAASERLLVGPERPIVLAPRRADAPVAAAVAPGASELGVMLPYSPLHHLLVADAGATLVMTSGNVSDEPIAYGDEDARERLRGIADVFLMHNRPIQTRTDDSVLRVVRGRVGMLRRSRGYVPASLPLPGSGVARPVLGCGAELKSTFCVAKGERAWVSHHIGDLQNYETLRSFLEGVEHFERLFAVAPEVLAHDLHPEYLSTKYAIERAGEVELVAVQHHHAHLAACLAEHGISDPVRPVLGVIYDGTGYGEDGTVWGGELLLGDLAGFRRVGSLAPVRMPGGERAIRQPWRMACAWLGACDVGGSSGATGAGPLVSASSGAGPLVSASSGASGVGSPVSASSGAAGGRVPIPRTLHGRVDEHAWDQVAELARTGVASPQTTSMGRLFDAVAALCGIRAEVNYEGQAAIELEAACAGRTGASRPYPLPVEVQDGRLVLDPRPTLAALSADVTAGLPVGTVAVRFHSAVALATVAACERVASEHGVDTVVLSGGVFQNRRLLSETAAGLEAAGLRVLVPERLPCNDGGIAYGQVAVAAARMAARAVGAGAVPGAGAVSGAGAASGTGVTP